MRSWIDAETGSIDKFPFDFMLSFTIRLSHSTFPFDLAALLWPQEVEWESIVWLPFDFSPLLYQSLMLVLFRFLFLLCVIRFPAHQVDGIDKTHELQSLRAGRGAWPSSGCIRPPTVQLSHDTSVFSRPRAEHQVTATLNHHLVREPFGFIAKQSFALSF